MKQIVGGSVHHPVRDVLVASWYLRTGSDWDQIGIRLGSCFGLLAFSNAKRVSIEVMAVFACYRTRDPQILQRLKSVPSSMVVFEDGILHHHYRGQPCHLPI